MKHKIFILVLLSASQIFAQKPIAMKGDELFGSIRARQIGPAIMSGRITDLEGHPTDAKIIYAGTAGGGVWKTNDAGITWNAISDKINQSIGAVALDPKNPDQIIWVEQANAGQEIAFLMAMVFINRLMAAKILQM